MRKIFIACFLLALIVPFGGTMPVTSPLVLFGENALLIKEDATFTATDKQAFVDMDDLNLELPQNRYITWEPDFWKLDGMYKFRPTTNARAGWVSLSMSDGDGQFSAQPVITITFGSVHSTTDGLTLYFSQNTNDYTTTINVKFYDSSNVLIRTDDYDTIASTTFATNQAVSDFKKIEIKFYSTNKPYRYARLLGIDFDTVTRFTGAEIKDARVVEQISPLSVEVPINTFDMTLFSADGDFSIVDPQGVYATFAENQPIEVYEQVNADVIHIGRQYIEKWNSSTANLATLKCYDLIGLLDKTPYPAPPQLYDAILSGWTVGQVMSDIIGTVYGLDYDLDASLTSVAVNGWAPHRTVREFLQQVMFASGAYVTCSRSGVLQVRPIELASGLGGVYDYTFTSADKGIESPIDRRPLVTAVEVTAHKWVYDGLGDKTVLNQSLAAGDYTFWFDTPHFLYTPTGATVTASGAGFVTINVAAPGTVSVTAREYADTKIVYRVENGSLPAGTQPNVIQITDAYYVNTTNAADVAQRVYDYYTQNRFTQKTKLFASFAAVGDSALIDVQSSKQMAAIIEKMISNLSGGFTQETELIGVVL